MKSICFLNSTAFWGGGEKLCLECAMEFGALQYSIHIAAKKDGPLYGKAVQNGLAVFPIALSNVSFLNPLKYASLVRYFRANRIDTLVMTTSHDLKTAGIAAKIAGVSNVVYLRGLASPIKNSLLNRFLLEKVLTHRIANSSETKRAMLKNMSHVLDDDSIKVIYHGIDLRVFDEKAQQQPSLSLDRRGKVVIGNAGRLTEQKGQHLLLEAARLLKSKGMQFELLIAGRGELQDRLRSQIDDYGLSNEVKLLGFVEDMEGFMKSIDIFALTSAWEGFGYVLVEAMASKKPVVAFDISSNPEIVQHNVTGYLVPYPDVVALGDSLSTLIADGELRRVFGERGRSVVERRFELRERVKEMEEYILATQIAEGWRDHTVGRTW